MKTELGNVQKRLADKTGEDSKITMYDMAAAAGASKDIKTTETLTNKEKKRFGIV